MKRRTFLKAIVLGGIGSLLPFSVKFFEPEGILNESYCVIAYPSEVEVWSKYIYEEAKRESYFNNPLFSGEIGSYNGVAILTREK